MEIPRQRGRVAVCLVVALCVLVPAGTAQAAHHALPSFLRGVAARHRPGSLPASNPTLHGAATNPYATTQLSTYGKAIRIGNSRYWMYLNAFEFPPDTGAELDVFLARGAPPHVQFYDYWWLRPATLTYDHKKLAARMNGGPISPSQIAMSFSPTRIYSHTCTLVGGGTGTYERAVGRLSISAFKFVTNTKPVFGTITVRPSRAELLVDPGCRSSRGYYNPHPCPRSETIYTPGPARSEWQAATSVNRTRTLIDAITGTQTPTKEQHVGFTEERLPLSDLPKPALSATGATATFLTHGAIFARGVGVFTSARAPRVVNGSCTRSGVSHTYTASIYRGVLSPQTPPLVALFDTGHIGLAANTPAYLEVAHLTS